LIQISLLLLGGGCGFLWMLWYRRHPAPSKLLSSNLVEQSWSSRQVGAVLGIFLFFYLLASGVGSFFLEEQQSRVRLIVALVVDGFMFLAIAVVLRFWRRKSWAKSFGVGDSDLWKLFLGIPLYLALLPFLVIAGELTEWIYRLFSGMDPALQDAGQVLVQGDRSLQIAYAAVAIFVAPIFEEIFFRGILFPFLAQRLGVMQGAVVLSLLFAGIHFHLASFPALFLLSLALCGTYWRSGSLWPGIGLHMAQNAIAILNLSFFYNPS
jgi:membrane protease YdiL (CAAX protease family)